MPRRTANVRYWGEIGLNADVGLWAGFGPEADMRDVRLLLCKMDDRFLSPVAIC
jgi:hypothetical protein